MKQDLLVEFDQRGILHGQQTLADYLPGVDPGLTPLGMREALLGASTLTALALAYGEAGSQQVLKRAGVVSSRRTTEAEVLDLCAARDVSLLPARLDAGVPLGWHLDEVNVREAWNQHWGGPDHIDWGGVKVGLVDTGYTRHPVFGFPDQPWLDVDGARTYFAEGADQGDPGPGHGIDPLAALYDGHGTRVGSVICGYDPGAVAGTYFGVAPKVPLVPVRIANTVLITHAQRELAQALRYLVNDVKVSVINLSMGFLPRFSTMRVLRKAIDEVYRAGVIFVCAAGQPLPRVISPAYLPATIAAAGTTRLSHGTSAPWGQSAYGPAVDWSAPAAHIHRAEMRKPSTPAYAGRGDGTSYAAAITTGAAALWLAKHRETLDSAYPHKWQRVEAFRTAAKETALTMPNQQPGSFGAGILNIGKLLAAELPKHIK